MGWVQAIGTGLQPSTTHGGMTRGGLTGGSRLMC